jgi:hypothetical protein
MILLRRTKAIKYTPRHVHYCTIVHVAVLGRSVECESFKPYSFCGVHMHYLAGSQRFKDALSHLHKDAVD